MVGAGGYIVGIRYHLGDVVCAEEFLATIYSVSIPGVKERFDRWPI